MVQLKNIPMINGVVYSYGSIEVTAMGETFTACDAINYADEQEIEAIHSSGNEAQGVSYNQITREGSITFQRHVIDRLEELSPTGRIQDLPPFEIIVRYAAGGRVKVHRLEFVIFKKNEGGGSKGDTELSKELPLFIGNIKWK